MHTLFQDPALQVERVIQHCLDKNQIEELVRKKVREIGLSRQKENYGR